MDDRALQIKQFEQRLNQLQLRFELYFQGLERLPPEGTRDELHRALRNFQNAASDAKWPTALKYRVNALLQRFTAYDQKWRREMVAIEKGDSRRDRLRAAQKNKAPVVPMNVPAPMPEMPQLPTSLSDHEIKKIYNTYLKARKIAGQQTNLSLDGMSQKLKKQLPALQKKHPGKTIGFKVVMKDGQAQLRAVVK
ncbi:MAG: hypothetical protein CMH56_11625 [Myxococcales bacterium]|nr:hypothetical protein [Myxococcales bacterium]|tara:strand:- start:1675 stop:2256 length:582 start_codon:yes stop_codon:yes gene_type:complete